MLTESYTTTPRPNGHGESTAVTVGRKVFFAGGIFKPSAGGVPVGTESIDEYNLDSGQWTEIQPLSNLGGVPTASIGRFVLFGSDAVTNIYDTKKNTWISLPRNGPQALPSAVSIGNLAIFAGGSGSDVVDFYTLKL